MYNDRRSRQHLVYRPKDNDKIDIMVLPQITPIQYDIMVIPLTAPILYYGNFTDSSYGV